MTHPVRDAVERAQERRDVPITEVVLALTAILDDRLSEIRDAINAQTRVLAERILLTESAAVDQDPDPEPDIDDEPPPDVGPHPGAVIVEYD